MEDCIFCKIANKETSSKIEYEDEDAIVFYDINPKAPLHLLIVPKKHIPSVKNLQQEDEGLAGKLMLIAKSLGEKYNLPGYRLAINVGREGGQDVDHLHVHFLANTKI